MSQTLTTRVNAILNTPGTGELVSLAELNTNFSKFDNHFIPAAKMHFTGVQTLTDNVSATQDFDVVSYDTFAARAEGAMINLATNQIIVRRAGVYNIVGANGFASNGAGLRRSSIQINGTAIAHTECPPAVGGVTGLIVATTELLAVNDAITLVTIQTSGGNLGVSNGGFTKAIFLSAVWAGAGVEV